MKTPGDEPGVFCCRDEAPALRLEGGRYSDVKMPARNVHPAIAPPISGMIRNSQTCDRA
jgi:hypothetical protein